MVGGVSEGLKVNIESGQACQGGIDGLKYRTDGNTLETHNNMRYSNPDPCRATVRAEQGLGQFHRFSDCHGCTVLAPPPQAPAQ